MTTWITVCDTCKGDGWGDGDMSQTDGEVLAELVETAAAGVTDVKTRRISCLMGCKQACNVTIQAEGKMGYTLGRFDTAAETAEGIVAYASAHSKSDTGQVPFRDWPDAIKGHFITRHPALPKGE